MTNGAQAELLRKGEQIVTLRTVALVGVHEIATMLGLTRQRVHQLVKTPDFPPPLAELAMGSVWDANTIAAWNQTRRRRT